MHFAGGMTGCQGSIPGNHDQLVAGLLQHAQGRLALGLQRALQHGKTGKTEAGLRLIPGHLPQLGSRQVPRQSLVSQGNDPADFIRVSRAACGWSMARSGIMKGLYLSACY